MGGGRASELLRREVHFRDIRLGVVVDLLVDAGVSRVLGLEVLCGDRARRFLPLGAADVSGSRVAVDSALVLMENSFYHERATLLGSLRGRTVRRQGGDESGLLVDLVLEERGEVHALVVDADGRELATAAAEEPIVSAERLRPAV